MCRFCKIVPGRAELLSQQDLSQQIKNLNEIVADLEQRVFDLEAPADPPAEATWDWPEDPNEWEPFAPPKEVCRCCNGRGTVGGGSLGERDCQCVDDNSVVY